MVFSNKKAFFVKFLRFDKIQDVLPLKSLYIITIMSFVKYIIRMKQISTLFFGNSAKNIPETGNDLPLSFISMKIRMECHHYRMQNFISFHH